LWAGLLYAVLSARSAAVQSPAVDPRGIYVYSNDVSKISNPTATAVTAALNVTGADGLALAIAWSAIEPAMGQYQWSLLDQWMDRAIGLGKKVDLVLLAGDSIPAWLFQAAPNGAGVKGLSFTFSPHSGKTGQCQSETIASPWDATYLARWDSLLAAVAAHLKSSGTYSAVALLRLTGINRSTDELRLPAETSQSTGLACVSDAVTTWQQAGYRPSLLLQAWDKITASFQKSFPDKSFSVAIIPVNAFPPIAEDGSVIEGTVPDQNQPLLALAAQRFPSRLVVQFDFLMPGQPASPVVIQAAQVLGTLAAFQTNEYLGSTGQGAACSEPVTNPTPCTAATYLEMLKTGIYPLGESNSLRAQYIEVFQANANAFPDDIQQAHALLVPAQPPPPQIGSGGIVNNASYAASGVTPGEIAAIFGVNLTDGTSCLPPSCNPTFGSNGKLNTTMAGAQVTVNQTPVPIFYATPGQLGVQIPFELTGTSATVVVSVGSQSSPPAAINVTAVSPGIFTATADGKGAGAITHPNGAAVTPQNPAQPNEVVIFYATGLGQVAPAVPTGALPAGLSTTVAPVTLMIGGITVIPEFAGLAGCCVGLNQINARIPAAVNGGDAVPVVLNIAGKSSNMAIIAVQ
jgi:uncharacterized protein (TIGR03437 family)